MIVDVPVQELRAAWTGSLESQLAEEVFA